MSVIGRRGPIQSRRVAIGAGLAILAAVIIAVVVAPSLLHKPAQAPVPAAPPGAFRPTDQQWEALTFASVTATGLREQVVADGRIAAADPRTTQVFAPVSGRIVRVIAQLGQAVRAGQPLAELDGVEFAQAAGDLASARVQLEAAQASETRIGALYKDQGAALKDLQQAQSDLAAAQNALQNARARLLSMGASASEVAALEKRQPGQPPRFILRAPIAGVVIQQAASNGQATGPLTTGVTTPLFTVSDLSQVWVVGALREEDAGHARVGQAFEATLTAAPDQIIRGRIDYVSPVLDPVTRRVVVRGTVANPQGRLRPEMFVSFALLGETSQGPTVPSEAVIYEGDQAHVWVAEARSHLLRLKPVKPGRSMGGSIEILSGLTSGDVVVSKGALFVDQAAKAD